MPSKQIMYPRKWWLEKMLKVALPVLEAAAESSEHLQESLPSSNDDELLSHPSKDKTSHTQAFCRTLAGIMPWLTLDNLKSSEVQLQKVYRDLVSKALGKAMWRRGGFLDFTIDGQCLVEAGFLSLALLRDTNRVFAQYYGDLSLVLIESRMHTPSQSNWLLFSGIVEAALSKLISRADLMRINAAMATFDSWYVGDGMYGDGREFHFDYYNSIVIHPFMRAIWTQLLDDSNQYLFHREFKWQERYERASTIYERMISLDGTFPPVGRSLTYRAGCFHLVADAALHGSSLSNHASTRQALGRVIEQTLGSASDFDKEGFLVTGLQGEQPSLAEYYICAGSLYMCMQAFLPLGLPPSDIFWRASQQDSIYAKIWNSKDVPYDEYL